ncbi:MAG: AAA family ATPase [Tunicatimonas sp.]
MHKLPVGLQNFQVLRTGGYLYVDKTALLHRLVTEGKYYFLSRPRRFGKSLMVSTLAELFQGHRELFTDLWIDDQWDWTQTNPVIHLSLNSMGYKEIGLEKALTLRLNEIAAHYGLSLQSEANSLRFRELIQKLHHSFGPAVVLIDEYDKPIIDYLDDLPRAEHHRDLLKSFYSVLKDADPHLRLVLLTGVSKFSQVSIFSELNNLADLTLHPEYTTLLGYTQTELEHYFGERITDLAPQFGGKDALLQQIKKWYNGYSWDGANYVYNPFSMLSFFSQKQFRNFWFETGTPTFLVKLLNREHAYQLEDMRASAAVFSSFELRRIDPKALLFQTGYVTIRSVDEDQTYTLSYPNKEVRDSLLQYLLAEYTQSYPSDTPIRAQQMKQALQTGNTRDFVEALNGLFATIPYQIFIADREAYYHSVTYLALSLMGTFVQVEVSQAHGRPDAVVHTANTIYVMEFKLDEEAAEALAQIKAKGYAQPYLNQGKAVKAIGIRFSSEQKQLNAWVEEVM